MFSSETRRQAAAFDAIGERYDDVFPHKSGQIIATQWMIDRLPSGARVLDLGCGSGVPSAGMLAESGIEVVGIDVSTEMLALARRNVPTGRFVAMDVMELDDSLGRFDGACAFFSLWYIIFLWQRFFKDHVTIAKRRFRKWEDEGVQLHE